MRKRNIKVILIHGNGGGKATDHWFPYIKTELEKLGLNVIARNFPDSILAREKIWLSFLKNNLQADENSILVGHSSGAVAAMRFAQSNKILGSILVGACYTDLGDETEMKSNYYNHPWEWEKIRENQKWIVQFVSTDDPYIPITEARFIKDNLKTEYFEYMDQGHFGTDQMEKLEFPEIVNILKNKLAIN